jgi:hypothetical protein
MAENQGMEFVAEPWVGRSIPQLFKQRGIGISNLAEIFYCIILQTGREYLLYVYNHYSQA